jgi:hypothetical protein
MRKIIKTGIIYTYLVIILLKLIGIITWVWFLLPILVVLLFLIIALMSFSGFYLLVNILKLYDNSNSY